MDCKHIAVRSKSVRSNDAYTTPGLGDRAHEVLKAHLYGKAHDCKVTLHLTKDKYGKPHKKISWNELLTLVPNVDIEVHDVAGLEEDDWLQYLKDKGIEAEIYRYKEIPTMLDGFEASQYFTELPCLPPPDIKQKLPKKFVTAQFDSTDPNRNSDLIRIEGLLDKFRLKGCEIVTVGGASKNAELRDSILHIAHAMHFAEAHVGVDSGMMHLAQFYKRWEQIHILTAQFTSHHLIRAKNYGALLYG
tara:strand:+ start:518 stop:1255 length:738 start_codon:yes stop_codon:yes gene_type:complete